MMYTFEEFKRPGLKEAVADFAQSHPELGEVEGAKNRCAISATEFLTALERAGVVDPKEFGVAYYADEIDVVDGVSHRAAVVDRIVIDFTARQFGTERDFPEIYAL